MKKTQLTQKGLIKFQEELKNLKQVKRPYAIDRLQKARSMGDLSENSEYTAAKEELALLEGRIQEIEELLKNVEVIQNNSHAAAVTLGSFVTVEVNGQKDNLQIVGEFEADPLNKKLSSTSPIGMALLNKTQGSEVDIDVPAGRMRYKILQIR